MKGGFRFEISGGRAGEKALSAKQKSEQKESFAGCDNTHFGPLLQTEGNPVKWGPGTRM
jgi:hypothetical protein